MNNNLDCVIIGNKDYKVDERLFAVGNDATAQRCTRRQYIKYKDKHYFYNEFFSYLRTDMKAYSVEEEYKKRHLTINEMSYIWPIYLTSYLRKKDFNVQCVNYFDGEKNNLKKLVKQNPFVVIISSAAYSNSFPIIKIINFIRNLNSNIKIVVSGEYIYNKWATTSREQFQNAMRIIGADFYSVDMPGEETIYELVNKLKKHEDTKDINNIFLLKDNKIIFNGFKEKVEDLDLNCIEWENIEEKLFSSIMNVKTSKGCPFNCSFCNFPIKGRKLKLSNISTVENQLNEIEKRGVKTVIFGDDTLNVPQERFKDLCKMMIKNEYSFKWFSYFRLKESDEETIKLMKESGCSGVFLGIESANDTILRNMNKNTTVAEFKEGLRLLNKYDIMSFAFFLVGFPGENKETIENTIKFIDENNVTFFTANLWYADITTPIYREKEKYGLEGKEFAWKHNTTNHEKASDFADYILTKVKNSVWVPNENFGFQGVAYLLNKGLTIDQVKELLRNAKILVESNIINKKVDEERIIKNLRKIIFSLDVENK